MPHTNVEIATKKYESPRDKRLGELGQQIVEDPTLRERIVAVHNFDRGRAAGDIERELPFCFGTFVDGKGNVIMIRNNADQKESANGWEVISCAAAPGESIASGWGWQGGRPPSGESSEHPLATLNTVSAKSCTPRTKDNIFRGTDIAANEILHLDNGMSVNILCHDDGRFTVVDHRNNVFTSAEDAIQYCAEQNRYDTAFDQIVGNMQAAA